VYLTATVLSRLGGFVLIPLYTRGLTEGEYGDYSLAVSAIALLPVLLSLGLNSTIPKAFFGEADPEVATRRVGGLARAALVLTAVGCLVGVGVAVAVSRRSGLFAPWEASCVMAAVFGAMASSVPDAYFRARQRPVPAAAFQLAQFFLSVTAGVVLVRFFHRGLRGSLEALAVTNLVVGCVALAFIQLRLPGRADRTMLRTALAFSLPLIPHFVANWMQGAIDRWLLKSFGLTAQLGNYALASQLASPIVMIILAWNDTTSARLGEIFRDGGVTAMLRVRRRLYLGYVAIPIVFGMLLLAVRPLIVAVLGAGKFSAAARLLPLLVGSMVFEVLYYPSSNLLYFAGQTRAIAAVTLSSAALSVLLNVVMIPRWGVEGAIAARTSALVVRSLLISALVHMLLVRRASRVDVSANAS
jgi:O-antigen/teichoic acid export membrane protein